MIGVGVSIPSLAVRGSGGKGFDFLFRNGEVGAAFDPSKRFTVFSDLHATDLSFLFEGGEIGTIFDPSTNNSMATEVS